MSAPIVTPNIEGKTNATVTSHERETVQISDKVFRALRRYVAGSKTGRIEIDFRGGFVVEVRMMEKI